MRTGPIRLGVLGKSFGDFFGFSVHHMLINFILKKNQEKFYLEEGGGLLPNKKL
jgi:hypothetical protein